ncbi:MAG TPA: AAA family ATPase [Candidatus Dormibacteraeota bacterium]|nr:AAA family ATPase [Candidatus Dormibacteraeota bacterium]
MLLGRAQECARVEAVLETARSGQAAALLLTGEPGIGKTAILRHAVERARGFRVLHAVGVQVEASWPYAGLHALLWPLVGLLGQIPERQARALEGALALAPIAGAGGMEVGAATLSLLEAAAEREPLLCAVDDAHWLDPDSARALGFAARRLGTQRLAMIVAMRSHEAAGAHLNGIPELPIAGLEPAAGVTLLRREAPVPVAEQVARHLVAEVAGNPLALLELPRTLSADQLNGREPLPAPVRAASVIEQAFLAEIAGLSESARDALLVAAANDSQAVAEVVRACEGSWAGTSEAERARLLRVEGPNLRFSHPLMRSAVYHGADPERRRRAHAALAEALLLSDPDRSAWHRALAATGPDEEVARALEVSAARAERRGGTIAAARVLATAARLSPEPTRRAHRTLNAARAALAAGTIAEAETLVEEGLALADDALLRADLILEGANVAFRRHGTMPVPTLVAEAERVRDLDPVRASGMLAQAARYLLDRPEVEAARPLVARALALLEGHPIEARASVLAVHAWLRLLEGEMTEARRLALEVLDRVPAIDARSTARLAGILVLAEEHETARRVLEATVERERRGGSVVGLAFVLSALFELELRQGHLLQARALAAEGLQLIGPSGPGAWRRHCQQAELEARIGNEEETRSLAAAAMRGAVEAGDAATLARARAALGHLELSLGRPEPAVELLLAAGDGAGRNPVVLACTGDLVEALVRAGRRAEARATLAELERWEGLGDWTRSVIARGRALLADDEEADQCFSAALGAATNRVSPLERARTALCYGERLRRQGHRRAARAQLRAALETFELHGARRWAERARQELQASGATVRRRDLGPIEELTPQELQVALLTASGATTREVAERLFLSPRTVEVHLTRTYRKLGVRSRTELAARFAAGPPDPPPDPRIA